MPLDPEIAAMAAKDEKFSTPWSRRLHKMVTKMTAEELAEFLDLKRIDEAHSLIFSATYQLVKTPDISLTDAISACGRRLRGIRLGLATSHDMLGTFAVGLHEALKKAHGMDNGWQPWDLKDPLEVHLADMLIMEWQGMFLLDANAEEATLVAAQLERALKKWRDESYKMKVMKRLEELQVVDFNADDLMSRLLSLVSEFYLNHPAGAPRVQRGINLLGEIVAFDNEDFGSAYCLSDIKMKQGNPKGAYNIAHKAMDVAVASGFQYNAARLGLLAAEAIMAGARGPGYSMAQVKPLLEASRRRLEACRFWLPPVKYERYSGMLREHERRLKIKVGSNPNPRETSLLANQMAGGTIKTPQPMFRHCAGCKMPSIEMQMCSGCQKVSYCSRKCQREDWASHREACKRKQAERKASSSGKAK